MKRKKKWFGEKEEPYMPAYVSGMGDLFSGIEY
jgi:hypothetical protein